MICINDLMPDMKHSSRFHESYFYSTWDEQAMDEEELMNRYGVGAKEAEEMGYIPLCTVDCNKIILEFLEKQIYKQYKSILRYMRNLKLEGEEFYVHFLQYMEHNNYFSELKEYYQYEADERYDVLRDWCKKNRILYREEELSESLDES